VFSGKKVPARLSRRSAGGASGVDGVAGSAFSCYGELDSEGTVMSKALSLSLLLGLSAGPAFAADGLVPHRAVYDVSLAESAMESNLVGVSGRLVYEITGSACAGYSTTSRFVLEFQQAQGANIVSDLRTATFEDPEAGSFTFSYETYMDDVLTEQSKGEAQRGEGPMVVTITQPAPRSFELPAGTRFPNELTQALVEAANGGERFVGGEYFDGSSADVDLYQVSTVIAPQAAAPSGANSAEAESLADVRGWHMALAYFDGAGAGDQSPTFTLSGNLYENGVAGDTTYNYGELSVLATLTSYEALPETPCP
jgi:hypothetical protein